MVVTLGLTCWRPVCFHMWSLMLINATSDKLQCGFVEVVCTLLPAARMMRVAISAGCLLPDTGASRKSPPLAATACLEST